MTIEWPCTPNAIALAPTAAERYERCVVKDSRLEAHPSGRSSKRQGVEVSYGDATLKCKALEHYDFSDVDVCLMSAGGAVSKEWSPRIAAAGAVVIDNSSCWRYDADVPLVVPEVNADAVAGFRKKGIIANPNCSTAQLVVALKPLHDHAKIKRVVVATYQSVSGAGKEAMDELFSQTKAVY